MMSVSVVVFSAAFAQLAVSFGEVTQSIQDLDGGVPLIANRPAIVRVYPTTLDGREIVSGVNGRLHVLNPDLSEIAGSPFDPLNPGMTARRQPNPEDPNDTLNFQFTIPVGQSSMMLQFEFTAPPGDESPPLPVRVGSQDAPVVLTQPPQTHWYVRVDYRPDGGTQESLPDQQVVDNGDNVYRAIYPTGNDLVYRRAPSETPYLLTRNINDPGVAQDVLNDLAMMRMLMDPRPHALFAWLPAGAYGLNGLADPGRFVALGNADPGRASSTFAHELGHIYGMGDSCAPLGHLGVDVLNRIGRGIFIPPSLPGIMCPGLDDVSRHINLLEAQISSRALSLSIDPGLPSTARQDSLWVSGVVEMGGTKGSLRSAFQQPASRLGALDAWRPVTGDYRVTVEDTEGRTLVDSPFGVSFLADSQEGSPTLAPFGVLVPDLDNAAWIVLRNPGGEVLDRIRRSPTIPSVNVMPIEEISGNVSLYVETDDADGDSLEATVSFSPDLGQTWNPVAVGVSCTHSCRIPIDTRNWGSTCKGLVRVDVTDGWNTNQVTSKKPIRVW